MVAVVIEDSPELASVLQRALADDGIEVHVAHDAERGIGLVRETAADLVVLDVTLPGIDGIEACRRLRTFTDAYVVMLTGRDSEVDRLIGLSVGADDYVTKPFYARELVARIRAMQRRPRTLAGVDRVRRFGALEIDLDRRQVTLAGRAVELTLTEYELLEALAGSPRAALSRAALLEQVRGPNWFGDDHLIDVHVSNLRRKLGDDPANPRFIMTVRGFGFRMGGGERS